jgi:NhaP-type Na+/H+ or K+/H+ antiporter
MDQHTILLTIAVAVILGASGQVLASLTRMPAIVYLLILGILAGPYVLGEHALVKPRSLGRGLPIITSAFVAIILFEGGLSLRPSLLRDSIQAVRRLITVGAAVSLVATAILAKLILGVEWSHAFLFASLIVVTGPTVIAPILRRVRLRQRLAAVLKSESILIDPIGVIIAIVVLQYVVDMVSHEASWGRALMGFFGRAGYGMAIGAAMGVTAVFLFRLPIFRQRHNQHLVTLGAVGLALGAFALSEVYYSESGLMAVTVAGLIVAAAPLPFREELEHFKEQVTILGVSVLFILLAANVNLGLLRSMGHKEVLLILGLIFVVRPLSVWISTAGTSLTWREKNYISLMAPRGIVAAAMASYFADQLREHDLRAAQMIESMVFLTIAATVCIQGTWASWLARVLGVRAVRPRGILLVGVNEWSLAVAETAESLDLPVKLLDTNPALCEAARQRGFEAIEGDGTSVETYERIDLSHIGALVSMTPNDAVNTLACEAAAPCLD